LKTLRKKVLQQPPANSQALRAGLDLLKSVDLREQMSSLSMPVTWLFGEQDGLVKQTMHKAIRGLLPASTIHIIEKAAHAPFLSHTELFNKHLISFADQIIIENT
jgi:pimeloyl-[acyl-carrier protein] methyl ester esterase